MIQKLYLIFAVALFSGCGKAPTKKEEKPLILVSVAPYRFFAEQIAGAEFEVKSVVPVAANPHSFEPTAKQVLEISRGEIWFRIGEPFEDKVLPILEKRNEKLKMQDLRQGIALIQDASLHCSHCSPDQLDRHIWLSPKLACRQAQLIAHVLSETFPEKQETFQENLLKLEQNLTNLDAEISGTLRRLEAKKILVSHPAFGYFCRDYGLKQVSIEHEGKDPTSKHLEAILQQALQESFQIALALPQHNNKGTQMIAQKLHMPVRLVDPYSEDYMGMMKKLTRLIADTHD